MVNCPTDAFIRDLIMKSSVEREARLAREARELILDKWKPFRRIGCEETKFDDYYSRNVFSVQIYTF